MDQEKFPSLNKPSNANMPLDTVETLKQIRKQGLSISIVKNTGPSTTSADNRIKPNVLTVDKPKILPRPPITTDNKILQTRLTTADTRVSSGRVITQSSFLDSKAASTQSRLTQPTVSENKSFNQVWNNPCTSSESKSQGPITTTAANKISTSQTRMSQIHISDNKTPVSRSNQSMLTETKSQVRTLQGQRVIPNQQLADNDRMNPTSPPDAKVFTNQVRTGQQFVPTQEKSNPAQRVVTQKVADVKISNPINAIKQGDKVPVANRVVQNIKILPEPSQGKVRQNYNVKPEGKQIISTNSPMIVENKTIRLVATNVLESGSTRTAQCKTAQMRLHPSVPGVEGSTAVQTKMICTAVTKMVCYQSVPAQADKGMILQGAKVATTDMIQKTATSFDVSESSHGNPMSSRIATTKRTTTVMGSPAKKKCVKRIIPSSVEMCSKSQDGASPEGGNENNDQFFNNLKTSRTGLTITPVRPSAPLVSTTQQNAVGMVRMPGELTDKEMLAWESAAMIASQRGKPRSRGRRKYVEPVCLTLSSDDEEEHMQAPFNSIEEAMNQVHYENFPQESEGSKSGQSSPTYQDEENPESDDPQFPGVTNIIPKPGEGRMHYEDEEEEGGMHYEDEEEKDMDEMDEEESMGEEEEGELEESEVEEEEEEEEEEVPPEEEEEPVMAKIPLDNMSPLKQPLHCRSIRIGSFKIHPKNVNSVLKVYLAVEGISFNAPMVSDTTQVVNIILKPCDVTQLLVHFGKCLPILFIFTTPTFAENIRKLLNMSTPEFSYYDPNSTDEKVKKITFLIDAINEEQRRFLRHTFLNEKKVKELDQKTANEILVKSTPSRTQVVRCEVAPQPFQVSQENVISVTAIQPTLQMLKVAIPAPVPPVPLFIYPPPPQTGGINITSDDLACLNEGEFLNDAIIDFYLKYVFYEKLSDYHREKTHIFSSYFYPRLTQKSERPRGEDAQKSVQIRRHNMVKTWTRHVDIFSKDFIVIPVNQNVHWFLAIICYPGLVPEAPEPPPKPEPKIVSKSSDNVTSTDDQEENKAVKEPNSTVDGNNQNSDENSTASSNSMFESEEPDSEEPMPEAPDSSTHPDKNKRRKEAPCICIFDSLNGPNRSRIATMLREYLEVEWKMKKGTRKIFDKNTMQGFIMQCPQQNNYSDCGIYLLQYVESFYESPLPYFDNPIPNLSNWFPKEKVAKKRQELKDLILALKKKYGSNTPTSTTTVTTPVRKQNVSDSVPSSPAQTLQTDNR